jgi:DNA repair exonuclease SbcCD nuclease subunit
MSNKLPHAKPTADGMTDRLEDQVKLWERVRKVAEDHGVHNVYILGDLFDKHPVDAVTLTETTRCLSKFKQKVYLIGGNHDANTIQGGRFTTDAYEWTLGQIIPLPTGEGYCVGDWLRFWPMDYTTTDKARAHLETFRVATKRKRRKHEVLLMHQSVIGCKHLGWVCDDGLEPVEVCEGFDLVLTGHFHTRQMFGHCGQYLGAPMHHRFDDCGRSAEFGIIEFKTTGETTREWHDGDCPRFHTMTWKAGKISKGEEAIKPNDYLRVIVEATHAEYAGVKGTVNELIEEFTKKGIRARHVHKPIYHHAARLKSRGKTATMGLDEAVGAYPDLGDVDVDGLDVKLLKRIGRKALAAARSEAE